jgi:glycerophosphoryl diester phosphodiesterase
MENANISESPVVSAHRGAADLAPENTLPSLEKALNLGIRMLEVDVRPSRDGVFYDLHDPRVDRTTNGKGLLSLMRSSRVDRLDAGFLYGGEFKGVKIPRVEEVVSKFHRRALLYFDVKEGVRLEELMKLLQPFGLQGKALFWFKDPREALKLKSRYPAYSLKVNAGTPEEVRSQAEQFSPDVVECSCSSYSEELYRACRTAGMKLMISFHGKEELYMQNPSAWKAEFLNIHNVKPLLPLLKERYRAGNFPEGSKEE